jgi:hypothetical protein
MGYDILPGNTVVSGAQGERPKQAKRLPDAVSETTVFPGNMSYPIWLPTRVLRLVAPVWTAVCQDPRWIDHVRQCNEIR